MSKKKHKVFLSDKFKKLIVEHRSYPAKISLREAAKQMGVSASTLSRIENGEIPDLTTYHKICSWMSMSMDNFFIIPDHDKYPSDIRVNSLPVKRKLNTQDEKDILGVIERVSIAVRTLKFDGSIVINNKDYFFIVMKNKTDELLVEESRKRLSYHGGWETSLLSSKLYSWDVPCICFRRDDFCPSKITLDIKSTKL